jgi:hypothetical protein
MSIDFQQIYTRIRQIGREAQAGQAALQRKQERAWDLLQAHARDLEAFRGKVEGAVRDADPNLRCALPADEPLDARQPSAPDLPPATLIAVDGSQIVPDRHAALTYGLINVGAVILRTDSGDAPQVQTESQLLFEDELRARDGSLLDEGGIALQRDARERLRLLELAHQAAGPVVALTDGPVELWGAKDPAHAGEYQKFLQRYLEDLDRLSDLGVTLGGYVDKPAADLVVRLLEIATASDENLKDLRAYHPLLGVSDRWLFGRLLQPGERSAVFALQSSSRARYSGPRAIHFFYLNTGPDRHPAIARVEFPQWVAGDAGKLDLLHAILVRQSSLLGAKPYPYLLHRAHETARVSFDEKEQVERLLQQELLGQGIPPEQKSGKQSMKDNSGNKRSYGR